MNTNIRMYIYGNPSLKKYIKMHSFLYKELVRNPEKIKEIEENMKKEYHLTVEDRINKISDTINMAETIINTLK